MTFDRAKFLIERVTDLLSLGLEALMFGDLEEFKECLRRAVMAATMQQSVIAIRKKNAEEAIILRAIRSISGTRHPLRRTMSAA